MEACDYNNAMFLKLKEYAVRKTPHSCSATVPVDHGELQWMFRHCFNGGFDCEGEAFSKVGADVVVPCPRLQQVLIRLWSRTTGRVTVS